MKVKVQGLLNATSWLEATHGRESLAKTLALCSEGVRVRYMTAIPIEWHPVEELIELLEAAESVIGAARGEVSRQIGGVGAQQNTRGMFARSYLYLAKPDNAIRRIAGIWRQFNDEGEMKLVEIKQLHGVLEVTGIPSPHDLFCATLTGWTEVICLALGLQGPVVTHRVCMANGGARCLWHMTWKVPVEALPK